MEGIDGPVDGLVEKQVVQIGFSPFEGYSNKLQAAKPD